MLLSYFWLQDLLLNLCFIIDIRSLWILGTNGSQSSLGCHLNLFHVVLVGLQHWILKLLETMLWTIETSVTSIAELRAWIVHVLDFEEIELDSVVTLVLNLLLFSLDSTDSSVYLLFFTLYGISVILNLPYLGCDNLSLLLNLVVYLLDVLV